MGEEEEEEEEDLLQIVPRPRKESESGNKEKHTTHDTRHACEGVSIQYAVLATD